MRIGTLQFFSWQRQGSALPLVYQRAVERAQIMEATGYEAIWLAEHHFTGYSVCPSIHMMGVHIANHTHSLRIGTGVSLAAFYHPLRLAEEVALLDVLSGGRVNWGAGRGFDPTEFAAFGVPVEESGRRFHEAVEIVLAAWRNERLDWEGEFWKFRDIEVLPKPLQKPHPPVWLAAGSDGAVRWAGKHGYSMMLGPHSTFAECANHLKLYAHELSTHGHTLDGREIPVARFVSVAPTDREAEECARSGVQWLASAYMNASKATRPDLQAQAVLTMERSRQIDRYLSSVVIHGCVDRVVDRILQLREEVRVEYLMSAPLSHSSFLMFTDKVLPRIC